MIDIEFLRERSDIFRKIRSFFDGNGYLEVDTPVLSPNIIPELCLEVFETVYVPPQKSRERKYWLVPSPEIWMKKLIASHGVNIYQICKCFRNGESVGRIHNPEFTMLEYYTMNTDYGDSLRITEEFLRFLSPRSELQPPFLRVSMDEAFWRWAGFGLFDAVEKNTLREEALKLGLEPDLDINSADLYNLIFVHAVEPNLPKDRPVVLMDYPAFVPCLAKKHLNGKTVERWELYVCGIELANCYTEEVNPDEVRRYFLEEGRIKDECAVIPHDIDPDYWKIFERSFPACSGVALGADRLVMALTGRSAIDGVLAFRDFCF